MKLVSKFLPAAFAVLLLGFSAAPCRAQNEGPLLYAGLLGYTGGSENEAMLLSPAAIGQFDPGYPDLKFHVRLGMLTFKNNALDALYSEMHSIGLEGTKNISDFLSVRASVDYAFDSDISVIPLKATALFHPPAGTLAGGDDASGENDFFSVNPYVGIGIEVDLVSEDNLPDWGYGFHLVAGLEFVYESISVGLELSSNAVDMHGDGEIDNVAILLNIGIPF